MAVVLTVLMVIASSVMILVSADEPTAVTVNTYDELVAALEVGGEISLGADITATATLNVVKDTVINGNGKKLTYTANGGRVIEVAKETNGADLTVKDLDIVCTASWVERGINYNTNGTLTIDNSTISGPAINYAVNLPGMSDNCTVVINSSKITGFIALNIWGENSDITITDSELYTQNNDVEAGGCIAVNNDGATAATGTKITVNGGIISSNINAIRNYADAEITVSDTTAVVGIWENGPLVAVVAYPPHTDVYAYTSLQGAIDKCATDRANGINAIVKLTNDVGLTTNYGLTVAKGAEVILDLNGHKIASNAPEASTSAVITNKGNLLCMDSVGGGKITTAALNPDLQAIPGYASNTIRNEGTLTLESGVIENTVNAGAAYCVDNYQGSTFTMNGGELTATRCALRMFCNSATLVDTVIINDGVIKGGTRAIWIHLPGSDSTKAAAGNLTINGGTFDGGTGQSLYVYTFGNNHTATFITITGGTFENDVLFGGGDYKETRETVSITGGIFKGWLGRYLANNGWEGYHLIDGVLGVHEFADATCTEPMTCVCGVTEGEALGHNEVIIPGKEATCTEIGKTEGKYCSRCQTILVTPTAIAAGHVDENADDVCDRCGFVLKVEEEKDDAPTSIVDTIKNTVESVIEKATETATEAVENVVNSVRATAERISNAAEAAVKNVTETFEAIQANVTEFFDGLKARLEEIFSF